MAYGDNNLEFNNVSNGRLGFTAVSKGQLLYAVRNGQEFISKLDPGKVGQVLTISTQGLPQWVTLAGFLRTGLPADISDLTVDSITIDSLEGVLKASAGLVSGNATTDDLPEGLTNLYFTTARARASISGTAGRIDYNSTSGVINIDTGYIGQTSITTLGTITTGTWNGSVISTSYTQAQVISISGVTDRISISGTATVPIVDIAATYAGQTSITTLGTIGTGTWQGSVITTTYTQAQVIAVTGTSNRITIGGTGTNPTVDIAATYVGQTSITTLGTIGTGVWQGTAITTSYTQAQIISVTGTLNRISISGTSTDPIFDISASYAGQASINTLGTISTGVWQGTSISTTYTDAKIKTVTGTANRITIGGTSTDPTFDIAATYVGQTSIVTTGTLTTGKLGTGYKIGGVTMELGSDATGDTYYNASGILTRLPIGIDGQVLTIASGIPSWATPTTGTITGGTNVGGGNEVFKTTSGANLVFRTLIAGSTKLSIAQNTDDLTLDVVEANIDIANLTGTLLTTHGGTGLTTFTAGDMLYYASGTALSKLAIGTSGHFLKSTGSAPAWSALTSGEVTTALGYTPLNKAGDTMTAGFLTLFQDPTSPMHAVTKQYADALVSGLDWKQSCRCATQADITLSGNQTIDGVATSDGDRVLVMNQTDGEDNGIYIADSGAWSRSPDADNSPAGEVTCGMFTFIEEGTVSGGFGYVLITANPIILGTTVLVFTQFSAGTSVVAGEALQFTGAVLDVLYDGSSIGLNGSNELEIEPTWIGQTSITTLGTIATGTWQGTSISTTYTDAKIKTVTGTANRITIGGTATDPTFDISTAYVGQNTITTLGTISTGTWSATTIAANKGGTGFSSYTVGDILYADTTSTLAKLSVSTDGKVLTLVSGLPSWEDPTGGMTNPMTTLGDIIYGGASGTPTRLAGNITTTKKFLRQTGDGVDSAAPDWDTVTKSDVGLGNVENTALSTWAGSTNLTTLGTIGTGVWQGTSISTTYTDAKLKTLTGTSNRITIGGTATDPTVDIAATYVGQASITTLGTIATGVWQGTSISTTYTDAKIKTVTGTSNRLTIGGTATDPTFDISTAYVGQATITTLGTITTGVWNGTKISEAYGGTNQTTYATLDLLYATAANTLGKLSAGSPLQVLRINAGGTALEWSAAGAGTITGSGTTNKMAKFTSSTAIGDSQISDDGTDVFISTTGTTYIGATTTHASAKMLNLINTNDSHLLMMRNSANANAPRMYFYKSRGSYGSETDVSSGDQVGSMVGFAKSTSYLEIARIQMEVDGTFTTTQRPPGRIIFQTAVNNGSMTTALTLNTSQQAIFATDVGIGKSTAPDGRLHTSKDTFSDIMFDGFGAASWEAAYVAVRRGRGTAASKSDVQDGDLIGSYRFKPYSGATGFWDTIQIDGYVDGTVTTNQRPPTRLEIYTSAANTSPALALKIDSSQNTTFSGKAILFASTTSKASLNMAVGTAPSSPVSGDVWHDTTQKTLIGYLNSGIKTHMSGGLWVQTAATTVASTAAETTMLGTGVGTKTLPANFFVVGKVVRIRASGVFSVSGTPTLRIKVKLGSNIVLDSGDVTTNSGASNTAWGVECVITCRSTGGSGTVMMMEFRSTLQESGASSPSLNLLQRTATVTIDTTAAQAMDITADWSASSPSNTITCHNALMEVIM